MVGPPPTTEDIDIADSDSEVPPVVNANENKNNNKDGGEVPLRPLVRSSSNVTRRARTVVTRRSAVPPRSPTTQDKLRTIYGPLIQNARKNKVDQPQTNLGHGRGRISPHPNGLQNGVNGSSSSSRSMPKPPPAPVIRLCPETGLLGYELDQIQPSQSPPPITAEVAKLWILKQEQGPPAEQAVEVVQEEVVVSPAASDTEKKEEPITPQRDDNLSSKAQGLKTPPCFVRLERLKLPVPSTTSAEPSQESQESQASQKQNKEEKRRKRAIHYTFTSSSSSGSGDDEVFAPSPFARKCSRFNLTNGHHIASNFNKTKTFITDFRGPRPQPPASRLNKAPAQDSAPVLHLRKAPAQDSSYVPWKGAAAEGTERSIVTRSARNGDTRSKSKARVIRSSFFTDEESSEKEETEDEDEDLKQAILLSKRDADRKLKMEQEAAKLPCPASAMPLTEAMIQEVTRNFDLPPDTKIVVKFTLTIRQGHLALYKDRQWLEDPNIDFYLEMIRERNEKMREAGFNYPKICVFHSFFFKFCSKNEFEAVSEFTNDNIFDCDLALFPILIRDHWRLIVADFKRKTLFCYDSLFRVNDQNLEIIQRYLEREYNLKMCQPALDEPAPIPVDPLSIPLDIPNNSATMSPESEPEPEQLEVEPESEFEPSWRRNSGVDDGIPTLSFVHNISEVATLPFELSTTFLIPDEDADVDEARTVMISPTPRQIPPWDIYFRVWRKDTLDPIQTPLPQQKNGSDCGIFLCQYAESLARGVEPPFDFSQVNMLYFRYLMAYETIRGELMDRSGPLPPIGSLSPPPT